MGPLCELFLLPYKLKTEAYCIEQGYFSTFPDRR